MKGYSRPTGGFIRLTIVLVALISHCMLGSGALLAQPRPQQPHPGQPGIVRPPVPHPGPNAVQDIITVTMENNPFVPAIPMENQLVDVLVTLKYFLSPGAHVHADKYGRLSATLVMDVLNPLPSTESAPVTRTPTTPVIKVPVGQSVSVVMRVRVPPAAKYNVTVQFEYSDVAPRPPVARLGPTGRTGRPVVRGGAILTAESEAVSLSCLPILTTSFKNPAFDTNDPNWAANVCKNDNSQVDTWLNPALKPTTTEGAGLFLQRIPDRISKHKPRHEWMQILNPASEMDDDIVGASGAIVATMLVPHVHDQKDVPFTHPFGFDWSFWIAPDAMYTPLLSPNNGGGGPENQDGVDGRNQAAKLRLWLANDPNHKGVLEVETEGGLSPGANSQNGKLDPNSRGDFWNFLHDYGKSGDRAAVFGRWIVDAGHANFTTEIHPPLVTAVAHRASDDETDSMVISRPFLSSQEFSDGWLLEHLLRELGKILGDPLALGGKDRMEAKPSIFPKPFAGFHIVSYTIRPASSRLSPADTLVVRYHFRTHTGVGIKVLQDSSDADAVTVLISLDENSYNKPVLPAPQPFNVTPAVLRDLNAEAGNAYDDVLNNSNIQANFAAFNNLKKGILTDQYHLQTPPSVPRGAQRWVRVDRSIPGGYGVVLDDDSQPYPIYGWLDVKWLRLGTQRATEPTLHLDPRPHH